MENLNWLFWAYAIGWLIILAYLFSIGQKERALRKKIANLQELIEDRWKKK